MKEIKRERARERDRSIDRLIHGRQVGRQVGRSSEKERARAGDLKHLSVHQWIRSAIPDSQQPTSPIGFLFLKLPPPPCAVLLVIGLGFGSAVASAIPLPALHRNIPKFKNQESLTGGVKEISAQRIGSGRPYPLCVRQRSGVHPAYHHHCTNHGFWSAQALYVIFALLG